MLFSISACLILVASTKRKIGLLLSMAVNISVMTCDACAADHMVKIHQAFSLCFCILQAIKNWSRRRPGNEASWRHNKEATNLHKLFWRNSSQSYQDYIRPCFFLDVAPLELMLFRFCIAEGITGLLWHQSDVLLV